MIITTAAFPFIPAELNLGHMASTYIPADVFNRFMNMVGQPSLLISATDVHGAWVKKELAKIEQPHSDLLNEWHERYQRNFEAMSIQFNNYGRTDSQRLYHLVQQSLIKLKEKGYIYEKKTTNYSCNNCMELLPKRFRVTSSEYSKTGKMKVKSVAQEKLEMRCAFCGSQDISSQASQHWVFDLSQGTSLIAQFAEQQRNVPISNYLKAVIREGLVEWDFTRENYLGIPIPFGKGNQFVYLWYESLLGYISLLPEGIELENVSFRHFLGKNILYYHGIVWPLVLSEGLAVSPQDLQISARGFLNLQDSDPELTSIEMAEKLYGSDYVRFYLAYRTPDLVDDYTFTADDFKKVINNVLCNRLGSFFRRCELILQKNGIERVPETNLSNSTFDVALLSVHQAIEQMKIRQGLLEVQNYVKQCGQIIEQLKIYSQPTSMSLGLLARMMAGGLFLLAPYIPNLVETFNIFNGLSWRSVRELDTLGGCSLTYKNRTWKKHK
ncbi:class I tRNA ligase family protein [Microcystis aeruginosa]|jgi:methionyl-tRNA synthetase|nr:class I tRNA ligase family protein [Microcystis aeruginosa]